MENTKRIEYIDALRGFTMIMVVVYHMSASIFNINEYTASYNSYMIQFRMPLFFFISGFVFYKKDFLWNTTKTLSFIINKFKVQILSTFIFFLLLITVEDIPFTEALFSRYKNGYWFTVTLFEFFVLHITFQSLLRLLGIKGLSKDIILMFIGLIMFKIHKILLMLGVNNDIIELIGCPQWDFYTYFVFGTMVRKYFTAFENALDKSCLISTCLITYFVLNIIQNDYIPSALHKNVCALIYGYTGIIIVFALFRKHKDCFSKERTTGKVIQFIGRRTLDIYCYISFLCQRRDRSVSVLSLRMIFLL